MLRFINQYIGLGILSSQTNQVIGYIRSPIINPNNLVIPAFYCQKLSAAGDFVLHTDDIVKIDKGKVVVNDETVIMSTEELVRLSDIIDKKFELIDKPVKTKKGKKIGKVKDFAVDDEAFYIQKIYVTQSVFKSISTGTLMFDRSQIYEVTNKKVVIKHQTAKEKSTQKSPAFDLQTS